jgi:hypothetical protein
VIYVTPRGVIDKMAGQASGPNHVAAEIPSRKDQVASVSSAAFVHMKDLLIMI